MKLPRKNNFQDHYKRRRKAIKSFKSSDDFRLINFTVFSCLLGVGISAYYAYQTIIPFLWLLRVFLLCMSIAYVSQAVFFRAWFPLKRMEYIVAAVFGITPLLFALFFILNSHFVRSSYTMDYKVQDYITEGEYQWYFAEGLPCKEFPQLCRVHKDVIDLSREKFIRITFSKGLFGFERMVKEERVESGFHKIDD